MIRVGLIGARGYVGRELIGALDGDDRFDLTFASSRAMAGKRLSSTPGLSGLKRFGDLEAEALSPEEAAGRSVDVAVLGLPNGLAAPYVDALEGSGFGGIVIDLSADYRHREGWTYGSPELTGETIACAKRIANPGCYATAANLALRPFKDDIEDRVSVFGVSGFSGAGTTPGPRNDPERLEGNLLPYGFGGHGHEGEIAAATGLDITFAPHVAPFFRGLVVTAMIPLKTSMSAEEAKEKAAAFYANAKAVRVQSSPPEARDVAGTDLCRIGGFAVSGQRPVLTLASALDNLRKGAATQAIENIELALGL